MAPSAENRGSRAAAYLLAGGLATLPGVLVLDTFIGPNLAAGSAIMAWITGVVSLVKKRQDPAWDRGPATGHH